MAEYLTNRVFRGHILSIQSVSLIEYPKFPEDNGQLSIFQTGDGIPYDIKRVFTVLADSGDIRGAHSHIACTQILTCLAGKIRVVCDDGCGGKRSFLLERNTPAVLIPPGIWATQEYLVDQSVLMVICDKEYDPADYIREYDKFIKSVKVNQ